MISEAELAKLERFELALSSIESNCVCRLCGEEYWMDYDKEPTSLCNTCAQVGILHLPALLATIRELQEYRKLWKERIEIMDLVHFYKNITPDRQAQALRIDEDARRLLLEKP